MDANIYTKDGTLIVDFRKPIQRNNLYREVKIEFGTHNELIVCGNKANFDCQLGFWGEKFDLYNQENMDKVLPEYIEDYERPALHWTERPILGGKEWKTPKMMKRIKPGFFEYKNTNFPRHITASVYIIYREDGDCLTGKP